MNPLENGENITRWMLDGSRGYYATLGEGTTLLRRWHWAITEERGSGGSRIVFYGAEHTKHRALREIKLHRAAL